MKRTLFLLLFIVASGIYTRVNAQVNIPTATGTMGVSISQVLDITVTTGSSLTFTFNTIALLDAGITQTGATVVTYRSNMPWYINISATNFTETGAGSLTMPASVIQFRLTGGSTFTPLSTNPVSLDGTSLIKNTIGKGTVSVDFFVNPGYIYAPANDYSSTITYTISNT